MRAVDAKFAALRRRHSDTPDICRVRADRKRTSERLRAVRRNNAREAPLMHDWLHRDVKRKLDAARRRARVSGARRFLCGRRREFPTIGRDQNLSSAPVEPWHVSDVLSWLGRAVAAIVASDPKRTPPQWIGADARRTIAAAPALHFRSHRFWRFARHPSRQATSADESALSRHPHKGAPCG